MIIRLQVFEQTLSIIDTKSVPRKGSKDYLVLQFMFSSDWKDLSKICYLQRGEVSQPIDVAHAGTQDDPIPAERGMEYVYGLYYADSEDGKLYLCQRTGEVTGGTVVLQYMPHELVGQYFVEVS